MGAALCFWATLAVAASPDAPRAPRFEGLGPFTLPGASRHKAAQRWLDQGFVLAFAFQREEASRSFDAATRADPACIACWWGLAWSQGPTIHADADAVARARIDRALARAKALLARAGPRDRAIVEALAKRHPPGAPPDEAAWDKALAALAKRFPKDALVAFLAAEAHANLHPWDWWDGEGRARPWTAETIRRLDVALKRSPGHPGATHLRLHVTGGGPAPSPDGAVALARTAPGMAHFAHLPGHAFERLGRYAEASAAHERAAALERSALAQVEAQGAERLPVAAHAQHALWISAAFEGRSAVALAAAKDAYGVACGMGPGDTTVATLQHHAALQHYALVRFQRWDEILRSLPPDTPDPYPLAVFHFARGTAWARTGNPARAREELARLVDAAADPRIERVRIRGMNTAAPLARIARATLEAEIARAEGDRTRALERLREATRIEDGLAFNRPHLWLAPTRHALGAMLLEAGRPEEAERAFREDLARHPENGWALAGLARALRERGLAADEAERRFALAWRAADFVLPR